ncbi:MAG: lipase maturation factor family protein [Acidobacteriaceae bacterium]|nr:lipase maturation factor family protein [Acidobacteriaceae bacterium]
MNLRQLIRKLPGAASFQLTEALFLRLLGLIYITAFGSFWPQIVGLIGSHGIEPAGQLMSAMRMGLGRSAFLEAPTLFWFALSDRALAWCCIIGCLGGLLLLVGVLTRVAAGLCWILYLSITTVGQPFTGFQWDALLLEAGFLALFAGASWLVWASRFLLFRLMFESGLVKLLSHDPNWRNLHALRFHFVTQPLPNPVAYYAYRAPERLLDAMTAGTLAIELSAPFLLFAPRPLRRVGVGLLIFLQLIILLTGNYAFFNLLALALCLWGLDDGVFAPLAAMLRHSWPKLDKIMKSSLAILHPVANLILALLMGLGAIQLLNMCAPGAITVARPLLSILAPFEIVNNYGLFAVMTTTRPEIVLEGSNDQLTWREYSFRYKPGELHRPLPLVAPHQPRLDWQMWFAALGTIQENSWVSNLMYRILVGEPSVTGLLDPPPFPKPPRYMRALLYKYDFTTPAQRARTGAVWQRELQGAWFGPVSLTGQ